MKTKRTHVSGYTLVQIEVNAPLWPGGDVVACWQVYNNFTYYGRIYKVQHWIFPKGSGMKPNVYWFTYHPNKYGYRVHFGYKIATIRRNIVAELAMMFEQVRYI